MTLQGLSLIAGRPGSSSARTFHGVNPASGATLAPAYHAATAVEVDLAAQRAAEAFPVYRQVPAGGRAVFLRCIAGEIEALGDALLLRYVEETALPLARARSERGRTCGQLRMFADLVAEGSWVDARIDHAQPQREPLPKPDSRSMLKAIGPVVVFGPANFPLAFSVAGGDTASALAAGCPVIVKAHSSHPGVSEYVGQAVQRAVAACGLPAGVFSLLFGGGRDIGAPLVQHTAIKAVGFTGSRRAGFELFDLCFRRPYPIPFFGELSSLNPVFILPGRLREAGAALATGLHASVTLGMGQFCTRSGLVLVGQGGSAQRFMDTLSRLMAATPEGTMLNASTRQSYVDAVGRVCGRAGVDALVWAETPAGAGSAQARAVLLRSDMQSYLADPLLREEMFGPAVMLLEHGGKSALLAFAAALEGHLTASVHGTPEDLEEHSDLLALLETKVGRIVFDGFPTGVEVCSSMVHSGPWPATTDGRFTSVGTAAIHRWVRPICYQNTPDSALPDELKETNPLGLVRLVDGNPVLKSPAPTAFVSAPTR
jgi:NADP-dependent aldehyde dehydrogenase